MKWGTQLALAAGLLALASSAFSATFSGADDFNDNVRDPLLWGLDDTSGSGTLNEVNSRLEFTGGGAGVSDANRPWILNYASIGSSWELRLDVFNSHVAAPGEVTSFGFEVFERGDPNDSVFVEIFSVDGSKGFYSVLRANDVYAAEMDTGNLGSTFGSVQISYDSGVMTTSYDVDGPANGFSWIQLASFGIDGTGGSTGNASWGLNRASEFSLNVYGYAENTAITSGMLYGDNFNAVPEPSAWALFALGAGAAAFLNKRLHRKA